MTNPMTFNQLMQSASSGLTNVAADLGLVYSDSVASTARIGGVSEANPNKSRLSGEDG
jgi:hypothetical protein